MAARANGRKVVYVANIRLPTEKGHGWQIMKMCEALVGAGARVVLYHPLRHQQSAEMRGMDLFSYYSLPQVFEVRTLRNVDAVPVQSALPETISAGVNLAHELCWGLYAGRQARREGAHLYYTRDAGVGFWLVRMGLPTVYEAHRVPSRAQRWLLRKMASSPKLKGLVALTSFIREGLVRLGVPEERIAVMPDAVDLAMFQDLPGKDDCRTRLGLPLQRPIIGYIGRFETMGLEKGIVNLIEAVARLPVPVDTEPLLVCVGGPMNRVPAYVKVAERCQLSRSRFQFLDRVNNREVPYWIRACDIATIPWPWTEFSAYYTSPLKLFEYMAAGVPIVATDLPALREVLRHGENAWLVRPGDPAILAAGIQHLLDDRVLAEEMASRASGEVETYTWRQRGEAILRQWV